MKKHILSLLVALSLFAVLILPASAEMNISASSISMSNGGETAIMELTFTCEFAGYYSIDASITQTRGRLYNFGFVSYGREFCGAGELVTAIVEIPTVFDLAFKPGPAEFDANVNLYDDDDTPQYDYGSLNTIIRLKK